MKVFYSPILQPTSCHPKLVNPLSKILSIGASTYLIRGDIHQTLTVCGRGPHPFMALSGHLVGLSCNSGLILYRPSPTQCEHVWNRGAKHWRCVCGCPVLKGLTFSGLCCWLGRMVTISFSVIFWIIRVISCCSVGRAGSFMAVTEATVWWTPWGHRSGIVVVGCQCLVSKCHCAECVWWSKLIKPLWVNNIIPLGYS